MIVLPGSKIADYGAPKNPAEIAAKGYRAVVRYLDGSLSAKHPDWKALTIHERDLLWAAGLGILLVWETHATRPFDGALAGQQDGHAAAQDAFLLGYPTSLPIIVAIDTDVTPATVGTVTAYWKAFADACHPFPAGVYGDWECADAFGHLATIVWQPAASSWSHRKLHPLAHMVQTVAGSEPGIDHNDVLKRMTVWSKP